MISENCNNKCHFCLFPDIIVGAPCEGSGAIYIYNGDASLKNKIRPTMSQRITMQFSNPNLLTKRTNMQTFGFSISELVDIDDNGLVNYSTIFLLSFIYKLYLISRKKVHYLNFVSKFSLNPIIRLFYIKLFLKLVSTSVPFISISRHILVYIYLFYYIILFIYITSNTSSNIFTLSKIAWKLEIFNGNLILFSFELLRHFISTIISLARWLVA